MSNQGSKPSVWLLIVLLLSLLIGACSPADDQASGSVETAVASTLEFEHAMALRGVTRVVVHTTRAERQGKTFLWEESKNENANR